MHFEGNSLILFIINTFWQHSGRIIMGTLLSKLDDKMPEIYSYGDYERIVTQVNQISMQIQKKTQCSLSVNLDSLELNYTNWKNSILKATLGLFPYRQQKKHLIQKEEQEASLPKYSQKEANLPKYSYKQTYKLVLSMRQLYETFELLKYFKKPKIIQKSQLTQTPLSEQGKGCQICFDQVADLALPCGHIFGAQCISKYIIDKELKICPMCRHQFIGRRSSLQKNLYIVIDQDQQIFHQVRGCLFDILKVNNEKVIKSVGSTFSNKEKSQN